MRHYYHNDCANIHKASAHLQHGSSAQHAVPHVVPSWHATTVAAPVSTRPLPQGVEHRLSSQATDAYEGARQKVTLSQELCGTPDWRLGVLLSLTERSSSFAGTLERSRATCKRSRPLTNFSCCQASTGMQEMLALCCAPGGQVCQRQPARGDCLHTQRDRGHQHCGAWLGQAQPEGGRRGEKERKEACALMRGLRKQIRLDCDPPTHAMRCA